MATCDLALMDSLHAIRNTPSSRRAPRLPTSRSLFGPPSSSEHPSSLLTREALSLESVGGRSLGLSLGGKPWWDCSEVVRHEKREELASPEVLHLEHSMEEETPYGSATSINSLGFTALPLPDYTNTRAPSEASSDDSMALPGAFDESLMSTSYSSSALGLQFDEDFDLGEAFAPFAGSSPALVPFSAPPPSPALVLESLSLLPRKRPAVTALPTPPLSRDEPMVPATPGKSARRSSIPLPSLPTTPISPPVVHLSRFTSALQAAIQSPRSSRVELSPPPQFRPDSPAPTAEDSTKTWRLYGHDLHFTRLSTLRGHLPPSDPSPAFLREQRCFAECSFHPLDLSATRIREHYVKCTVRREMFEGAGEVDALALLCLEQLRESRKSHLSREMSSSPETPMASPRPKPTAFIPITSHTSKRRRRI